MTLNFPISSFVISLLLTLTFISSWSAISSKLAVIKKRNHNYELDKYIYNERVKEQEDNAAESREYFGYDGPEDGFDEYMVMNGLD
ncbi:MAG: hypothetical protein JEZ01_21070 [Labilibaculum sp.]|nr:hypothetical protein [Labilibaculum sp.]MBI9060272.1 hypothetical protein [Labilibaculum sp.]